MKRKAFTLVELLVVISVIALLVAIFAPTVTSARGLARAHKCRANLKQLSTAFTGRKAQPAYQQDAANPLYPNADAWASIPNDFFPYPEFYVCPEDEGLVQAGSTGTDVGLQFRNGGRPEIAATIVGGGPQGPYVYWRTGSDTSGPYTEFCLEDNINDKQNPWLENPSDGIFRVYPGPPVKLYVVVCACGEDNQLWYKGKSLWPDNPTMRKHTSPPANTVILQSMTSNYGINTQAEKSSLGSGTIVLLDSKEQKVDPASSGIQTLLQDEKTARHQGRINILTAGGSVLTVGPTEIHPDLRPDLWWP